MPRLPRSRKVQFVERLHLQSKARVTLDELRRTPGSIVDRLRLRLVAVEATVGPRFTNRFSRAFLQGPCFAAFGDDTIPHGLSGGPVLDEHGCVCGIVSAGGDAFFDKPTLLTSLLYPCLLTELALKLVSVPPFTCQANVLRSDN